MNLLTVFAVLATIAFAFCGYKFWQDPRYGIQDPFLLTALAVTGAATLLAWLCKIWW